MPKKIESDEELEFEDEEEDEELEEEEQEKVRKPIKTFPPSAKKQLPPMPNVPPRSQRFQRRPLTQPEAQPQTVPVRYASFAQQSVEGIIDNETKEILATDIYTALANIIDRLERIENSIGVMQGE
jgi:hypothetical protein